MITDFSTPTTAKKLGVLFGLVNVYRRFISYAATLLQSLNSLPLQMRNSTSMVWTDVATQVFGSVKKILINVSLLAHLMYNASSWVKVDASSTAVGSVFQQYIDGERRPISFFPQVTVIC